MRSDLRHSAPLGEVVAAAFDQAALYSTDQREVTRLATQALRHLLRRLEAVAAGPGLQVPAVSLVPLAP
jgi:hypothetical protein